MAERIQLKRVKGWRLPEGAVKVDRSTRWGNPYKLGTALVRYPALDGTEWEHEGRLTAPQPRSAFVHPNGDVTTHEIRVASAEQVVEMFRRDLMGEAPYWFRPRSARFGLEDVRTVLAGRDLACWCPLDHPCHADVLLQLAAGTLVAEAAVAHG